MSKLLIIPQVVASLPGGGALSYIGSFLTPLAGKLPTLEGLKDDGTYETLELNSFDGFSHHNAYIITHQDKAGTLTVKLTPNSLELLAQGTAHTKPTSFRMVLLGQNDEVTLTTEHNGKDTSHLNREPERTPLLLTRLVTKINYCLPIDRYPRDYKDYILTTLKHCYYSYLVRF